MRKKLAIVTGGGSGIGRCTALALARQGVDVVIVGRNLESLRGTQAYAPDKSIIPLVADLSNNENWNTICKLLPEGPIDYLVHNAATLGPLKNIKNISYKQWRETINTNAEAPLFLTQALLPRLSQGRILFISSGAADIPINHLAAYCCSKSLLKMIKRMLVSDLANENIAFSSFSPGVVDTGMQSQLRKQSKKDFPVVEIFRKIADEDELISPSTVADYISWLLLKVDRNVFSAVDNWDFQNQEHFELWVNDH